MFNLSDFNKYKENNRLEAKDASGGLPKSLWETYSAFANTNGGVILLGVKELEDKSLKVIGLSNPDKLLSEFWNNVNNPEKVSASILLDKHVRVETVEGGQIIVIEVPRSDRGLRPVYIKNNPMTGTFRRNHSGDYHCKPEVIRTMFRDSGDKTQDMLVLDKLSLDVFDYDSLRRYRNRMRDTRAGHVWVDLEDVEFLQKLGAIGIGEDDKLHPTSAGLLMFGFEYEILREYPQYFLDYQERYDISTRWTDRINSSSGEWSGNLYDFYFKAYNKLIQNPKIKIPFKMEGIFRIDDTPVHKALREALANCITNADFYGERGLVIRNNIDDIVFENPGSFRVTIDEALSGGISSPRNSVILKMFNILDIGERTGSGIPLIFKAWEDEGLGKPTYVEQLEPERSFLTLPLLKETEVRQDSSSAKTSGENKVYTDTDVGANVGVNVGVTGTQQKIIDLLVSNPRFTAKQLSEQLGISKRRIESNIKSLKDGNRIERMGADKNGYWVVK